jgi:hypothetical protein
LILDSPEGKFNERRGERDENKRQETGDGSGGDGETADRR